MTNEVAEISALVAVAVRARAQESCAHRDYVRALEQLAAAGVSQSRIGELVRVSQPAVSKMLGRRLPAVPEGFADVRAYWICERYAAGQLDADELVAQLSRWEFAPMQWAGSLVEDVGPVDGTFGSEMGESLWAGLIDEELYDRVLFALHPETGSST
ncbi:MAG: hypothetical protein L0H59_07155 [Tomitella sp.]|nr:hypothetical protein [Tomitella sp.]